MNFDDTLFALHKFMANIFILGCSVFYHYKEPFLFLPYLMLFHPWIQPYLV